jgi:hypothetical protein
MHDQSFFLYEKIISLQHSGMQGQRAPSESSIRGGQLGTVALDVEQSFRAYWLALICTRNEDPLYGRARP